MLKRCTPLILLIASGELLAKPSAHPGLSIVTTSVGGGNPHLLPPNADYSRKVSVSVSSVFNKQEAAAAGGKPGSYQRSVGTRSVPSNDEPTALRHPSLPDPPVLNAWPAPFSNSRVDVHVYGEKLNSAALSYLQPDLSRPTLAKLRVILGADYDDAWMSIEPRPPGNESTGYPPSASTQYLVHQVEKLNFDVDEAPLGSKEMSRLKKWLIAQATCPVQYVWRDTGNRYWPRWIRHAVCQERSACSWPPGMKCKPSGTKTLTLLRWYCTKQSPEEIQKRARRNYLRRARSLYGPPNFGPGYRPRNPRTAGFGRRRFTREERRSKRVKRLVRKLSRSFREYYCEWHRDSYTLQPECSCMC